MPSGIYKHYSYQGFQKGQTPLSGSEKGHFKKGHLKFDNAYKFPKGEKLSEGHKLKLRVRKRKHNRKIPSIETRFKISKTLILRLGKGGITPLIILIRKLREYKIWRKQVFQRDDYTCQKCLERGIRLEAHHKKSFKEILQEFLINYSQFSPIEDKETLVRLAITYVPFWDVDNGVAYCKKCHRVLSYSDTN